MDGIKIIWSISRHNAQLGAIEIDKELYYIYFGPGLPKIFNKDMNLLTIPNIDNWISSKTKQRYSLRTLNDIIIAYLEGVNSAFSEQDVLDVVDKCVDLTVKRVARSQILDALNKLYWIESASATSLTELINKFRNNFGDYRKRLGDDVLHNILCRIYKTCSVRQFDGADAVEAMMSRLDRSVKDPVYPVVDKVVKDIKDDIIKALAIKSSYKHNLEESVIRAGQ